MSETTAREGLNPTEVASFLRRHPEFLSEYPDIALTLAMPRYQGASTSLAHYQLDVLREQKREFNSVTSGLWGATSLPPALGQVSTLLVAGILGPEAAGAVFGYAAAITMAHVALHDKLVEPTRALLTEFCGVGMRVLPGAILAWLMPGPWWLRMCVFFVSGAALLFLTCPALVERMRDWSASMDP